MNRYIDNKIDINIINGNYKIKFKKENHWVKWIKWQENFYSKKINKRIIFLNLYRIIELNIIFLLKKKYRKKNY
jgi:hypothetical protein